MKPLARGSRRCGGKSVGVFKRTMLNFAHYRVPAGQTGPLHHEVRRFVRCANKARVISTLEQIVPSAYAVVVRRTLCQYYEGGYQPQKWGVLENCSQKPKTRFYKLNLFPGQNFRQKVVSFLHGFPAVAAVAQNF